MGTRSDFYVMNHDGSMEWLGSAFKDGGPQHMPTSMLLKSNRVTFEESVFDYLKEHDSVCKFNGQGWPWPWDDSQLTDYTYIFHVCSGKVLMSEAGGRLVDPIEILRGMDMIGADVGIGQITFPLMRDRAEILKREIEKEYGSQPAEAL